MIRARVALALFVAGAASAQAQPRIAVTEIDRAQLPAEEFRLDGLSRNGEPTWLRLRQIPAFTPDARLVVVGPDGAERERTVPELRHFAGTERGQAGARVFMSLGGDGSIRGWVTRGSQVEAFARPAGSGGASVLSLQRLEMGRGDGDGFSCAADDLGVAPEPEALAAAVRASGTAEPSGSAPRMARIAVETDLSYLALFDGDVDKATRYAVDMIGFASATYINETGYGLAVTYLRFWEGSEPWVQTSSTHCRLFEFGQYWNVHMEDLQRSTAVMFSAQTPRGGLAWFPSLCSSSFDSDITYANCPGMTGSLNVGGAYAYVGGMYGSFNPAQPQVMWDSMATAHEIGHNLGSPHTHCYANYPGNGAPVVDQCATEASSSSSQCYESGPTSLPGPQGQGSGTLMSYCHLQPGGFGNVTFTLGAGHPWGDQPERVPARIGAYVQQRDLAAPGCFFSDGIFADGFQ
jgi:hypothetical protein